MLVKIRTVIKTNALKPPNNVKNIKISVQHGCDGEVSTILTHYIQLGHALYILQLRDSSGEFQCHARDPGKKN